VECEGLGGVKHSSKLLLLLLTPPTKHRSPLQKFPTKQGVNKTIGRD